MSLLLLINAFFIFKVIFKMKKMVIEQNRNFIESASSRLKWYPIVLIFCFLPTIILGFFPSNHSIEEILLWFQAIVDSIQGLLFVIVYSLTPEVNQATKQLFLMLCRRGRLNSANNNSEFSSHYSDEAIKKVKKVPNMVDSSCNINTKHNENLI